MRRSLIVALVIALAIPVSTSTPAYAANPTLNFYISPPTVQNTFVDNAAIVTFNGKKAGDPCPKEWISDSGGTPTTIGTITATKNDGTIVDPPTNSECQIRAPGKFGGAVPNADDKPFPPSTPTTTSFPYTGTNFAGILSGKSVTLSLNEPQSYLGFWWSAGDRNNKITLFSGGPSGTQVGVFTTGTLKDLLGSSSSREKEVTAIDGAGNATKHFGCLYYGNPLKVDRRTLCSSESGGGTNDPDQPFAYIHLIGEGGLTFDTIVFAQVGSGGFEFDNLAIATDVNSPDGVVTEFPAEINAGSPEQVANTCEAFSTTFALTASNFTTSPTYSIDPTTLPEGLTFNPATGGVSGTPTAGFTKTTYTLTATAGSQTPTETVSLEVNDLGNTPCPPPPDPPASQSSNTRSSNSPGPLHDTTTGPQLAATGAPAWPMWAGVVSIVGGALIAWTTLARRHSA